MGCGSSKAQVTQSEEPAVHQVAVQHKGEVNGGGPASGAAAVKGKALPAVQPQVNGCGPGQHAAADAPQQRPLQAHAAGHHQSPFAAASVAREGSTTSAQQQQQQQQEPAGTPATGLDEARARAYQGAARPANDEARVATLEHLDMLDSQPDPRYDDITRLLCGIFKTPISQLSLVAKDRQWFKSVQGLDVRETDRNRAFCAWVLVPRFPEVLVIEDTTLDPRFKDNPQVLHPPHIRFYAGAPLIASNGHRLGSLCVADIKPRKLDAEQLALLCNFAEMVVREMEKDKLIQLQRRKSKQDILLEQQGMERVAGALQQGMLVVNIADQAWQVVLANDVAASMTGRARDTLQGCSLWDLFHLPAEARGMKAALRTNAMEQGREFALGAAEAVTGTRVTLSFRPASSEALDEHAPQIGIPSNIAFGKAQMRTLFFCFVKAGGEQAPPAPMSVPQAADSAPAVSRASAAMPFDDVRLGPLVGRGSFGKVYRGVWNGAIVAIKVIEHQEELKAVTETPDGPAAANGGLSRLSQATTEGQLPKTPSPEPLLEAVLSLDLHHPNVIKTYKTATRTISRREGDMGSSFQAVEPSSQPPLDYFALPGELEVPARGFNSENQVLEQLSGGGKGRMLETWLVLQYADKGSLQAAIERGWFRAVREDAASPPNLARILTTAREIAGALSYLHDEGILHSDLTGGNILLGSSDRDARGFTALIADFGLSRMAIGSSMDTESYGTVTHMPPELLVEGKLTKAADVYAFGVILWEMYTGQRPFQGMRHAQIIYQVASNKAHPTLPDEAPDGFKAIAHSCMASERSDRPTFDELLDRLDALQESLPQTAP